MSYKDQGGLLGNLIPSVFIDNITLETGGRTIKQDDPHVDHYLEDDRNILEAGDGELHLTVDCSIKEITFGDPISQWFDNKFSKYVELVVVVSRHPLVTAALSSSNDGINLVNDQAYFAQSNSSAVRTLRAAFPNRDLKEVIQSCTESKTFNIQSDVTGDVLELTQHNSYVDEDGQVIHDINFRASFDVPGEKPEHLSIFAVTRLDMGKLIDEYNLRVDETTLRSQNGKIASEIVIDRGAVVEESFVFTRVSDATPWSGPVHDTGDGNWATGDFPSSESELLRFNKVSNNKVQDFRNVSEINKLVVDMTTMENKVLTPEMQKYQFLKTSGEIKLPKNVYFSELYLSRDRKGKARMSFAVDYARMLKEQALFPELFDKATKEQRQELISSCKIRNLKIVRRRIKEVATKNSLGNPTQGEVLFDRDQAVSTVTSSSENSRGVFRESDSETGSIREAFYTVSNSSLPVRFFAATDKKVSEKTDGIYQYGVEMVVEDASQKYLLSLIRTLRKQRNKLYKYYLEGTKVGMNKYIVELQDPHIDDSRWERAAQKRNSSGTFTPSSGRFTKRFVREQYGKYSRDLSKAPWVSCVIKYFQVLNIFTGFYKRKDLAQQMLYSVIKYADPKAGSPKGVMSIIKVMDNLISRASLIAGAEVSTNDKKSILYRSGGRATQSKFPARTSVVQSWFTDSNFDTNENSRFGFDYLSNYRYSKLRYKNLRVVTGVEYQNRVRDEFLRYYQNEQSPLDVKGITKNDSYLNSGFGYLSPGVALLGNSKVAFGQSTGENNTDIISPQQYSAIEASIITHKNFGAPVSTPLVNSKSQLTPEAQLYKSSILDAFSGFNLTIIPSLQDIPLSLSDKTSSSLGRGSSDICSDVAESLPNDTRVDPVVTDSESKGAYLDSVKTDINPNSLLLQIQYDLKKANKFYDGSTSSPFGKTGVKKVSSGAKNSLASTNLEVGTIDSFNLNKQANVINWMYKTPEYLLEASKVHDTNPGTVSDVVMKMPNQIKSLFSSSVSSGEVTNRWHSMDFDAIRDPKTSSQFSFLYNLINRVEVLLGYQSDTKTPVWKVLSYDFWKQTSGKELICRMKPYEFKLFGIFRPKSLQIPIYDEYFILSPKRASDARNAPTDGDTNMTTILPESILDNSAALTDWVVSNIGVEVPAYPDGTPATNLVGSSEPNAASYPCGDLLKNKVGGSNDY